MKVRIKICALMGISLAMVGFAACTGGGEKNGSTVTASVHDTTTLTTTQTGTVTTTAVTTVTASSSNTATNSSTSTGTH